MPQFEINDTVRIDRSKSNGFYFSSDFHDQIGTIISLDTGDDVHGVKVAHLNLDQYVPARCLTKVRLKEPTLRAGSQNDRILKYLLKGKSITPLQAFSLFGTYRLAARIDELRKKGHKIVTDIKSDETGRTYASYSLRKAGRV